MTRSRYVAIVPSLLLAVVAVAVVLGMLFTDLPISFFLALGLVGGAAMIVIDRLARQRVSEPITDERIQGISEQAALVGFRISGSVIIVAGMLLMYVFPATDASKVVGVGACCAVGVQGLAYSVAYLVIRSKR
jgi:uncharacterized membrane protein